MDPLRHPIVAAALAAHGLQPEDIEAGRAWKADDTTTLRGGPNGLPTMTLRRTLVWVNWLHGICATEFQAGALGPSGEWICTMRMRNRPLGDTLRMALIGERLDRLMDLPGFEGCIIAEAEDHCHGQTVEFKFRLVDTVPAD